jgi:ribonuclease D
MKQNWVWVDNPQKLQKAVKAIRTSPLIGIDTEYDSFRYFREKLCLIQIKALKKTYLLDPFAKIDIPSLRSSFADPRIIKILHAGDNDIRILSRDYGFKFNAIFDTQKAAALLGCRYLSLGSIVEQFLGRDLKKTKKMQRSQWESRPLTEEQILYAVRDTEHLIELYRRLSEELREKGLDKKAAKAFEEEIASAKWVEKIFDPRGYRRIGGCEELNRFQKNRLKALHRWRFQKAQETNTALFMILSDQNLLDLSRAKVPSMQSLQKVIQLSPRRLTTLGPELVELLRKN